jgi:predicted negative regulator of RcsB-dependent stress response
LVKHNARWLALLVLLSVLAYWTWEWRQSPDGLLSPASIAAMRQGESDD